MALDTPLLDLHRRRGAAVGQYFGCALPEHFGDVTAEYARAREAAGLADAGYRMFAELTGPDRVRYLHAVVSNDIQALPPGHGTVALLLNPQGHILAELECYALPDRLLLSSHRVTAERTLATLDKFIIMDDATLADITAHHCAFAVEGPRAFEVIQGLAGADLSAFALYQHTEAALKAIPCRLVRFSHFGQPGVLVVAPTTEAQRLWEALEQAAVRAGGGPLGYGALNALRLEAGVPWFSHDFDDRVIPHEAALESSHISFSKGCYTGQEIVERVRSRGQVRRRRVSLLFEGAVPPAPEEKLLDGDKEVGHVTSAAFSPGLGRVVGMGYLRREHLTPGNAVQWSGGAARVVPAPLS